ncbi:MAG: TetR/AcrR family transcriptional regulator [Candidatus Obscuribacterales bacterium]|nr:TetR/AcrR family transcriptional regulator [Candidatus Obscuribacterales bacterium]
MAKISEGEADLDLKERILQTTEKLLRRFGASKLSVVDVAREIGMSHGNVYRFFGSKSVLLGAVAERWLCKVMAPLTVIIESDKPADVKLTEWINQLRATKRQRHLEDPEVFKLYGEIAEQARDEVTRHIDHLLDQVQTIIEEGKAQGIFHVSDSRLAAKVVLSATSRLHHPAFVTSPDYPTETEAQYLIEMVIKALKSAE